MFTEREQAYLKALSISALYVMQNEHFSKLSPPEVVDCFEQCLDDYLSHRPLTDYSDAD